MVFNKHSNLEGQHAFLGASNYHWLNYSEEKLIDTYMHHKAAKKGTELHDFANRCIVLGIKLPNNRQTLNSYVNDAIGYKMTPEQPLVYSAFAFGTPDAIAFRKKFLRIHDLKTGTSPASMKQLEIYAAFFCLEYGQQPREIATELRIYQNDDIIVSEPTPDLIEERMAKIIEGNICLSRLAVEV